MDPIVLIHGYSAESKKTTPAAIQGIYGSFPEALRAAYGSPAVVEIDLSRYISLEDGIGVDDIARALDRALHKDYAHLLRARFNVIVHSTGALVIRNWMRKFSPMPSPVRRILYLAGANLGSGWAHIGKGQLAKWARFVFEQGAERGVQVLDALELGSSWTLDLHLHFLRAGTRMRADYDVFEFVITGTQADVSWFEAPIRYAKEDGSDGVVRVSASNVNVQYLRLGPTAEALALAWDVASRQLDRDLSRKGKRESWYEPKEQYRPGVDGPAYAPLAIPYECAHSRDDMGIVIGKKPREQVLRLVDRALAVDDDAGWRDAAALFQRETAETYQKALQFQAPPFWKKWIDEPREQYDPHAQLIFRIRDQDGRPVKNYDVFFDSETKPSEKAIRDLMEDKHVNDVSSNVITFYFRTDSFDKDHWTAHVPKVGSVFFEVSATEPETEEILYLPMRFQLGTDELVEWMLPHHTTIIDVELLRLPSDKVFMMTTT